MDVKYARPWSVAFLLVGIVLTGLNVWLFLQTGRPDPGAVVGAMMLIVGVLSFINPFYRYRDDVLQARNLLGMTLFRHPLDRLVIEPGPRPGEKRLFVLLRNGRRKRVLSTHAILLDRAQSGAVISAVDGRKAF